MSRFGVMVMCVLCAVAAGLAPRAASAQEAPPPVGFWVTRGGLERFLIQPNGQCSFDGRVGRHLFVAGRCSWDPTSTGGVLTLTYPGVLGPQHIYFNVTWLNRVTLSIDHDIFHRMQ